MTAVNIQVNDSTGMHPFDPNACAHAYTYNGSNQILTDTATLGIQSWVKTYTYSGNNIASVSAWIFQGKS